MKLDIILASGVNVNTFKSSKCMYQPSCMEMGYKEERDSLRQSSKLKETHNQIVQ